MNETLDPTIKNLASAIKRQESAGSKDPYNAKGASGEFGAYQFMPDTYKMWAKQYLGDENAKPNIENQNKIAYKRIKEWKEQGLNPAQIAAAWNAGEGSLKDDKWKTNVGVNSFGVKYDTPNYVKNVSKYYQELKGTTPQEKITPENFDYGSIEDAQAEGRQHRGLELAKDFVNAVTEAPMVLGGGVLNAVTQAVGGEAKPTYTNPLGTEQNALGYRDGQELGAWETAKQGAGALAEGLSYGIGGGAIPEATQFGKASIGAYVKPAIKAGVQSGALQGFGSSLQKGDSVPVAMAKGAGTSILGGVLGGGLGLGGAAYNKLAGFSPEVINTANQAIRSGDDALAEKLIASPEYQQVIKANKYNEKSFNKAIDNVGELIDNGVENSYGKAKTARDLLGREMTKDDKSVLLQFAKNTDSPIADTKLAIQNEQDDLMNNAYTPIVNKIQQDGLQIGSVPKEQVIREFDDLIDNNLATEYTREQRIAIKEKIKHTIEIEAEPNGGNLDILGLEALRRNANTTFPDENLKGKVGRALGNIVRKTLQQAEATASPELKPIIAHINAVNAEWSRLQGGQELLDLLSGMPGQKPSELFNKMAGFLGAGAAQNNPLAYLFAHRVTNSLQKAAIRSRNGVVFGDMSGKLGPISSNELIGNAQRILKNVGGVVEDRATQAAATQAAREAAVNRSSAVNKLLDTISPKRDSRLPVIDMGPKAVSKYALADSKLPVAEGAPKVFGELSNETKSYMDLYEKNGVKTEPLSSESFGEKDRQKIINFLNKQPDAVVVAERDKLEQLISFYKGIVDQYEQSDLNHTVSRLNKLTDKRGEFKGQLNLNNAKGNRTKYNDTYLREAMHDDKNQYGAEELAQKFYDIKESYNNAKDILKDMKKQFKSLKSGGLPGYTNTSIISSLAGLTALGTAGAKAGSMLQDKYGKETYQRESDPVKPDNTDDLASQIANAETRGEKEPYSTWKWSNRKLGKASPLGKDLGKYQITSARLREKSMDFLGKKVTDQEFLNSPELQDKFIKAQIRWQKANGLTDEQVLATHRRGWGNLKPEQLQKAVATSSDYIEQARGKK